MRVEYNPCGIAKLLGRVLERDETSFYLPLGLPIERCPTCGKIWAYPITGRFYPYCNLRCLQRHHRLNRYIVLICDECGFGFFRYESLVVHQISKDNHQQIFCNRKCFGRWLARNYGFKKGHKSYAKTRI